MIYTWKGRERGRGGGWRVVVVIAMAMRCDAMVWYGMVGGGKGGDGCTHRALVVGHGVSRVYTDGRCRVYIYIYER